MDLGIGQRIYWLRLNPCKMELLFVGDRYDSILASVLVLDKIVLSLKKQVQNLELYSYFRSRSVVCQLWAYLPQKLCILKMIWKFELVQSIVVHLLTRNRLFHHITPMIQLNLPLIPI